MIHAYTQADLLGRLSFLKYTLNVAEEHSSKQDPGSALGLLLTHDAIELLIDLMYTSKGLKRPGQFMDAWEDLKTHGITLPLKGVFEKINKCRVGLKHHGIRPNREDVLSFLSSAKAFYRHVFSDVFGVDFDSVSLSSLVSHEEAKMQVLRAEEFLAANDAIRSLQSSALAFDLLLDHFTYAQGEWYVDGPFKLGDEIRFRRERPSERILEEVARDLNRMRRPLEILMLGIDYRRYAKFSMITPRVIHLAGGTIEAEGWRNDIPTTESASFAIAFVIEVALQLQDSYFEAEVLNGGNMMIAGHRTPTNEECNMLRGVEGIRVSKQIQAGASTPRASEQKGSLAIPMPAAVT